MGTGLAQGFYHHLKVDFSRAKKLKRSLFCQEHCTQYNDTKGCFKAG
jgi:hypothetical protein